MLSEYDLLSKYPHIHPNIITAVILYTKDRIRTGDFLYSVLCNDLHSSVMYADSHSLRFLGDIVKFIYAELLFESHGTKERVTDWLERKE